MVLTWLPGPHQPVSPLLPLSHHSSWVSTKILGLLSLGQQLDPNLACALHPSAAENHVLRLSSHFTLGCPSASWRSCLDKANRITSAKVMRPLNLHLLVAPRKSVHRYYEQNLWQMILVETNTRWNKSDLFLVAKLSLRLYGNQKQLKVTQTKWYRLLCSKQLPSCLFQVQK